MISHHQTQQDPITDYEPPAAGVSVNRHFRICMQPEITLLRTCTSTVHPLSHRLVGCGCHTWNSWDSSWRPRCLVLLLKTDKRSPPRSPFTCLLYNIWSGNVFFTDYKYCSSSINEAGCLPSRAEDVSVHMKGTTCSNRCENECWQRCHSFPCLFPPSPSPPLHLSNSMINSLNLPSLISPSKAVQPEPSTEQESELLQFRRKTKDPVLHPACFPLHFLGCCFDRLQCKRVGIWEVRARREITAKNWEIWIKRKENVLCHRAVGDTSGCTAGFITVLSFRWIFESLFDFSNGRCAWRPIQESINLGMFDFSYKYKFWKKVVCVWVPFV